MIKRRGIIKERSKKGDSKSHSNPNQPPGSTGTDIRIKIRNKRGQCKADYKLTIRVVVISMHNECKEI
jgi:hypothetical protein